MAEQLTVEALRKTFDEGATIAVDDVDISVEEGEIFCLLGPSGCGKTTTLRCIAGVETPDSGTITLGDEVLVSDNHFVKSEDRGLGMVYQSYAIWPHKTVYENVVFSLKYNDSFDSSEYEDRVMEILEVVKIPELKDTPATDLSGGQQQRTALARALVHNPNLLLLDEPLSNLDAKLRSEMRNEIQRIQQELGVTIIYVTHDQEEAFYLADQIAVMRNGQIVERGNPSDLYNSPINAFTREFVGRWNRFQGELDGSSLDLDAFSIDVDGLATERIESGDSVLCFVRPTQISLSRNSPDDIELKGTVIAEGVIGELYELTIQLDNGLKVVVQIPEHLSAERGNTRSIFIPTEALTLYRMDVGESDLAEGQRIRAG